MSNRTLVEEALSKVGPVEVLKYVEGWLYTRAVVLGARGDDTGAYALLWEYELVKRQREEIQRFRSRGSRK